MIEKQKLIHELLKGKQYSWKSAALQILEHSNTMPVTTDGNCTENSVSDLRRIFEIRRQHLEHQKIEYFGVDELLETLGKLNQESLITVHTFFERNNYVSAFWDANHQLTGCITIKKVDPDRGDKNIKFALGDSAG